MPRVVVTAPRALADIRRNAVIVRRRVSAASAARWNARIVAAIGLDLRCKPSGRRLHVDRVLFTIDGDAVNVLRVRHAAEDRVGEDDL
jgi:plasmid stabilization system protein ParE